MKSDDPTESHMRNCDYEIKEQDRYLPIANVTRVMKKALPEKAKLSKEAKECVQECASEYISFITSQAIDKCLLEKRKTLNGEDILWAMFTLGFEHYAETLKIYLAKYRQSEQEEQMAKAPRRRGVKNKPAYDSGSGSGSEGMSAEDFQFESPEDQFVSFDEFALQDGVDERRYE
ncbi:hypothetical protein JCM33374_g5966 [Metschnikowia sp. JCM 33374]|nr:hypothetical protein JCM33374_g5966 [Metschnikowia sp. JCM 33374]